MLTFFFFSLFFPLPANLYRSGLTPQPLRVPNYSFENPRLTSFNTYDDQVPAWTLANSGLLVVTRPDSSIFNDPANNVRGRQVAVVTAGTEIQAAVGGILQPTYQYTLKVRLGRQLLGAIPPSVTVTVTSTLTNTVVAQLTVPEGQLASGELRDFTTTFSASAALYESVTIKVAAAPAGNVPRGLLFIDVVKINSFSPRVQSSIFTTRDTS